MKCGLTLNERVFLEKYLKYRNGTKAVLETHNIRGKDRNKIASTMACEILQKPRVMQALNGFVSDNELLSLLKSGLNAFKGDTVQEDWNTRIKCLELCYRLK